MLINIVHTPMPIEILLTLIVLYFASIFGAYKFIQKAHFDPKGRYKTISTEFGDIIVMLIPLYNTIQSFMLITGAWKSDSYRTKITCDDFFKPQWE
jgi:hypothetical protein